MSSPLAIFLISLSACLATYAWILLVAMKEKARYLDLLHQVSARFAPRPARAVNVG
jgi:hypothetical protein